MILSKIKSFSGGYRHGMIFELTDASIWEQTSLHEEHKYQFRPDVEIDTSEDSIKLNIIPHNHWVEVRRIS